MASNDKKYRTNYVNYICLIVGNMLLCFTVFSFHKCITYIVICLSLCLYMFMYVRTYFVCFCVWLGMGIAASVIVCVTGFFLLKWWWVWGCSGFYYACMCNSVEFRPSQFAGRVSSALSLTWFNVNPSIDMQLLPLWSVVWNCLLHCQTSMLAVFNHVITYPCCDYDKTMLVKGPMVSFPNTLCHIYGCN